MREFSRSSPALKGHGGSEGCLTLWLDKESSSTQEQVEGGVLGKFRGSRSVLWRLVELHVQCSP